MTDGGRAGAWPRPTGVGSGAEAVADPPTGADPVTAVARQVGPDGRPGPDRPGPDVPGPDVGGGPGPARWVTTVVWVVLVLGAVAGTALRAWFIFHDRPTSDQVVAGLIAEQILHGHNYAFFWGQPFGGVEPYVVAAVFKVLGQSTATLGLAPALLSLVGAALTWRVARRLVADPLVAALAGVLAWAAPLAAVFQATQEGGYRGVVLVCGLVALLFALRILDGCRRVVDFLVLGLATGIGWWALPEIAYFLVPAGLVLAGAFVLTRRDEARTWVRGAVAAAAAFVVGALPWIWANVASGFASLDPGKFPGTSTPLNPGLVGRVRLFFLDALPLQLNLRRMVTSGWIVGGAGGSPAARALLVLLTVLAVGVVVAGVVLCLVRGGRAVAIGVAALAYPFLVAVQPGTWFWQDGRYTVYTGTLLALVLAPATDEAVRRWASRRRATPATGPPSPVPPRPERRGGATSAGRLAMSALVAGAVVLTAVNFHLSWGIGASGFFSGWRGANAPTEQTAAALERAGIRTAYADYWVAYRLDFVSGGRLAVTVAGSDPDRWAALDAEVRRSRRPAWLFVTDTQLPAGVEQFGSTTAISGPSGITLGQFTAELDRRGVPYRTVDAGLLTAVIPTRPVAPSVVSHILAGPGT